MENYLRDLLQISLNKVTNEYCLGQPFIRVTMENYLSDRFQISLNKVTNEYCLGHPFIRVTMEKLSKGSSPNIA